MRPALEFLLECDRFLRRLELADIYQTKGATRVRVAAVVVTVAMIVKAAIDIIRHADIKCAVETAQHVDVIRSHALGLLRYAPETSPRLHRRGVALASARDYLASLDCAPYGAPLGMTLGGTVLAAVEIRI